MPKMKTHSGAKKRLKKLKSGLVKHTSAGRRHLLSRKSKKRKRNLRSSAYISSASKQHIKVWLPN